MATIPIVQLEGGEEITPKIPIDEARVRHWKYARDCATLHGTFVTGARLRIVGMSTNAGAQWVRVELPGRTPPAFLKIAGEEYSAGFDILAGTPRAPELLYNIAAAMLTGTVDGHRVNARAGSGGRAGSKTPGAVNYYLANNALATRVGGPKAQGTHQYGPIPQGRYTLWPHETDAHKIRLRPSKGTMTFGRDGFLIHKEGPIGSHGCIVPHDGSVVDTLVQLVKKRAARHDIPVLLQVIAVGSDVDRQFRTA